MIHSQLKAFQAVVNAGGFTAAAKQLDITQPAITHQIKALETKYKTKLFHRNGRKVSLTTEGALLLNLSSRYFELEQEAQHFLDSITQMKSGKLRVACDIPYLAFPATDAFRKEYPNIELSFTICSYSKSQELLLDHLVDVMLTSERPENERIDYLSISEEKISLTISNKHPFSETAEILASELSEQDIYFFKCPESSCFWSEKLEDILGFPKQNVHYLNDKMLVTEAVANNQGVSFLSKLETQNDRRLTSVAIADCQLTRCEYLAFHKDRKNTPLISAFISIMEQTRIKQLSD
jgi:LysR family transcriptional regulator, low CO2-responsive transcriptional regulator